MQKLDKYDLEREHKAVLRALRKLERHKEEVLRTIGPPMLDLKATHIEAALRLEQ
jgi:hypothetical protein